MEYRQLGRTGLEVSVMGLGAGGPSRLGQRDSLKTEAESIALVRGALDAGINFIDTAEAYGTEAIVGHAIAGRDRDKLVISTKKRLGGDKITPGELRSRPRRQPATICAPTTSTSITCTDYISNITNIIMITSCPSWKTCAPKASSASLASPNSGAVTWTTRCCNARCTTTHSM